MGKMRHGVRKSKRRRRNGNQSVESLVNGHQTLWGRANEERLHALLTACIETGEHCPPWMYKVEFANRSQDQQGIDLIVTSDVGALFLQVKSSQIFQRKFEAQHEHYRLQGRRYPILRVVVVSDKLTDSIVLRDALHALHQLRSEVQLHGSSFHPARRKTSA